MDNEVFARFSVAIITPATFAIIGNVAAFVTEVGEGVEMSFDFKDDIATFAAIATIWSTT